MEISCDFVSVLLVSLFCPQVLIDGQFLHRIKVEDSMWSVDKKAQLIHIFMDKAKELMWKSLFEVCGSLSDCSGWWILCSLLIVRAVYTVGKYGAPGSVAIN